MSSKGHLTNFTPADFAAFGKGGTKPPPPTTGGPPAGPGPSSQPGAEDPVPEVAFDNVEVEGEDE
jgi:hypothetical protein